MKLARLPLPNRREPEQTELSARPYPVHVPAGDYLATCVSHYQGKSRSYGERLYLDFKIAGTVDADGNRRFEGPHIGKTLPMFLRPSSYPTSNYYRAWVIANGSLPSRNAKLSPRIFRGKLFCVRVTTVRPRHRIAGSSGKLHAGPLLPERLFYSKIECLLDVEVGGTHTQIAPRNVTEISCKPFSERDFGGGGVGSRELELGSRGTPSSLQDGMEPTKQPTNRLAEVTSASPIPPGSCPECNGLGYRMVDGTNLCRPCNGRGKK